jgi:tetratricopeptide (TPR) repeat protein
VGVVLALAALFAATDGGAEPAEAQPSEYIALVELYRSGAREAAVRALGNWAPGRIESGVDGLLRECREAESAEVVPCVRTAQGAFLLHANAALRANKLGLPFGESEEHIDWALRVLRWFRTRKQQPPEARGLRPRDFYMVLVSAELLAGRPDEASALAEESLRSYEPDVRMQLLAGCAADLRALLLRRSGGGRWSDKDLRRAEDRFRRVLEIHPENEAGTLRLGWVLVRRGRPDDALPLLQAVVRGRGDEDRRFLAFLFLGAAHEGLNETDAAIAAFRRATELAPEGQAAHVALARALERVAGQAAARAVLQPFFEERGRSWVRADPWNEYPFGPPELRLRPFEDLLERLSPR